MEKILGFDRHLTHHQGRHTFGTLLVSEGVSFESAAKMMGHSKIKTTPAKCTSHDQTYLAGDGQTDSAQKRERTNNRSHQIVKTMATTNFSIIPKDVFERGIIRMTEDGIITMPDKDVWMTVDEITDMLFVSSVTVFRMIRSIYNKGITHEEDTHGSFRLFPYHPNWNIDVYNLEMVIRLAYAIKSPNNHKFRLFIMNRLMARPIYENVCVILKMEDYMKA